MCGEQDSVEFETEDAEAFDIEAFKAALAEILARADQADETPADLVGFAADLVNNDPEFFSVPTVDKLANLEDIDSNIRSFQEDLVEFGRDSIDFEYAADHFAYNLALVTAALRAYVLRYDGATV